MCTEAKDWLRGHTFLKNVIGSNQLGYSFYHFQTWILGGRSMPAKDYSCSSQGKLKTGVRKPEATNIVVEPWMGKSQRGESSDCLPMSLTDPSTTCVKQTQWQATKVWTRTRTASQETEYKVQAQPRKTFI